MQRLLLVIDEFTESVAIESLFRRLGFDVLSVSRESAAQEAILGFPADLIFATAKGRTVEGLTLNHRLKFGTTKPKVIVLIAKADSEKIKKECIEKNHPVDAVLETPFSPRAAIQMVASMLKLPSQQLLDKYKKISSAKLFDNEELQIIKEEKTEPETSPAQQKYIHPSAQEEERRESRYKKALNSLDELPPMMNTQVFHQASDKLKSDAALSSTELDQINREKREFVKAMAKAAQSVSAQDNIGDTDPADESDD